MSGRFLAKTTIRLAVTAAATVLLSSLVTVAPVSAQSETGENWTGWYGGAHGGYRWADADFSGAAYSALFPGGLIPFPARNEGYDLDSAIVGL